MVNNALILDIPRELLTEREKWEERAGEYLTAIRTAAASVSEAGSIRVFPYLVGEEEPQVAIFFSYKLGPKALPTDSDYLVMYSLPIMFKAKERPSSWGMKRQIHLYTSGAGYGKPEIQDIVK